MINTYTNKKKLIKLMIYSTVTISLIFLLKTFSQYRDINQNLIYDSKKESLIIKHFIESTLYILHSQCYSTNQNLQQNQQQIKQQNLQVKINNNSTKISSLLSPTLATNPNNILSIITDRFNKTNHFSFYSKIIPYKIQKNSSYPFQISTKKTTTKTTTNKAIKIDLKPTIITDTKADNSELVAIQYFINQSQQKSQINNQQNQYSNQYINCTNKKEYIQYAYPIRIKKTCSQEYSNAIISIKIPLKSIDKNFSKYFKKELILTLILLSFIIIIFYSVYTEIFLHIDDIKKSAISIATRDSLTNLHNRNYLKRLEDEHTDKLTQKQTFLIAFLDIDFFKKINDTYGHDAGDIVLKEFALLLEAQSRSTDVVCRYGGEEFLIIIYGISLEQALIKFNTLREKIQHTPIQINNSAETAKELNITVSIGLGL